MSGRAFRSITAAPLAVALLLTCCVSGDGAGSAPDVIVRDSAGVEIVEVAGAVIDSLPLWRIEAAPVLSIGEVDGEEPYLFTTINGRTNVAVLSDGTLAITDGLNSQSGSREIRIFDADGRFVRRIGRAGEGPGEFTSPPNIQASSDGGIVTLEQGGGRRSSLFTLDGTLLDSWPGTQMTECARQPCAALGGVLSNGASVLTYVERPPSDSSTIGQTFSDLDYIFGFSTRTGYQRVDSVTGPPLRVYAGVLPNGRLNIVPRTPLLLMPAPEIVAGRDHAVTIMRDRAELRLIDSSGRLVRIIRVLRPAQRFSAAERNKILADDAAARFATARVEGREAPEQRPAFGEVRFGEGDDLWVWDYAFALDGAAPAPDLITIFGADGLPVARLEVRPDPLYGDQSRSLRHETVSSRDLFRVVTADALGVNRLLGFRIIKP